MDDGGMGALTEADAVVAERLAQEAVELPHIRQRRARPAVRRDVRLDLFPERDEQLGLLREAVQCVGDGLKRLGDSSFR